MLRFLRFLAANVVPAFCFMMALTSLPASFPVWAWWTLYVLGALVLLLWPFIAHGVTVAARLARHWYRAWVADRAERKKARDSRRARDIADMRAMYRAMHNTFTNRVPGR